MPAMLPIDLERVPCFGSENWVWFGVRRGGLPVPLITTLATGVAEFRRVDFLFLGQPASRGRPRTPFAQNACKAWKSWKYVRLPLKRRNASISAVRGH